MFNIEFGLLLLNSLLVVLYLMQFLLVFRRADKTYINKDKTALLKGNTISSKLHDVDHWPFLVLSIIFPFIVSGLTVIFSIPIFETEAANGSTFFHYGKLLQTVTTFVANLLLVLITLEVSLLFQASIEKRWYNLLLTALCLDLIMLIAISILNASLTRQSILDALNTVNPLTILLICICALLSFLASSYVIFCVRVLDRIGLSKVSTA